MPVFREEQKSNAEDRFTKLLSVNVTSLPYYYEESIGLYTINGIFIFKKRFNWC